MYGNHHVYVYILYVYVLTAYNYYSHLVCVHYRCTVVLTEVYTELFGLCAWMNVTADTDNNMEESVQIALGMNRGNGNIHTEHVEALLYSTCEREPS